MANECLYCNKGEALDKLMIKICDLEVSTAFVFKEQTYYGRCLVAYKHHDVELYNLPDEELLAYMKDVTHILKAMKAVFDPAKINYGAYSDKLPHLHFHLIPKYVDGPDYGSVFAMNPQSKYLTDDEYEEMVKKIKEKLQA
jgi:diadenosine tetraphosphate (Ap4A) HIT family hydrolase